MMMIDNNGGENDVDEVIIEGRRRDGHVIVEKEHMFDKVVTPSDVGKLNRLVIPKQHAEKYFPLDSSTNEKGLLLNFEDRSGKQWRFRYSYWNSSQSYVMTKGWSRFVKEKKLDAGDVVSFQRGMGEIGRDRLFIDWRRRPDAPSSSASSHYHHLLGTGLVPSASSLALQPQYYSSFQRASNAPWSPSLFLQQQQQQPLSSTPQYYPNYPHNYRDQYSSHLLLPPPPNVTGHHNPHSHFYHPTNYMSATRSTAHHHPLVSPAGPCSGSVIYYNRSAPFSQEQEQQHEEDVEMAQAQRAGWGEFEPNVVFESVPVVHGKTAPKRLRLFGVNMECPINTSGSSNSDDNIIVECDNNMTILSSSSTASAMNIPNIRTSQGPYPYNFCSSAPPQPLPPLMSNPYDTSSSNIPYVQLSPQTATTSTTSTLHDLMNKGKMSMSFDRNEGHS
ncbi:hypothetical protein DCAR_0207399 [Daucus carota subsp. sativus]|uniref:Uncharacterized protein n=1 Tax=Daucus carota subsp. sativus TaxID=79200 RepID=A0A161X459_DAUCS|nr:PREDICTED: B3 domain-containing protein Os03g0120900-like [Daucus carota subsp. sativus]XP_017232322.1 PREDICTED: B3 domain-containing protein Os03g0120900-like [Daucus carota subsp. sativus]XP_017232323.1 PREDICTED: B3 domain-containing protein Os03g0120900-like [Daucus carota subsp. sativus]XP_017232324.1 PREDICTED: B3 domain-containing protein Os03g0120900-like [Daucus carota subsp. sativus]WOG88165.1 hypothetical protein DCAR_0207399 [Daucus carota subsp. sativus]